MDPKFASMASQLNVEFQNVQDHYSTNENIICKYKLINNYKVQYGDRIAIFKNGWTSLKNYNLFEWVITKGQDYVVFKGNDVQTALQPEDWYQFCYISTLNAIHGISTPFQITSQPTIPHEDINMISYLKQTLSSKDTELSKLKEENIILKESLKSLLREQKKSPNKSQEEEITNLKTTTKSLQDALAVQQQEIIKLKEHSEVERRKVDWLERENVVMQAKYRELLNNQRSYVPPKCGQEICDLEPLPPFPF